MPCLLDKSKRHRTHILKNRLQSIIIPKIYLPHLTDTNLSLPTCSGQCKEQAMLSSQQTLMSAIFPLLQTEASSSAWASEHRAKRQLTGQRYLLGLRNNVLLKGAEVFESFVTTYNIGCSDHYSLWETRSEAKRSLSFLSEQSGSLSSVCISRCCIIKCMTE